MNAKTTTSAEFLIHTGEYVSICQALDPRTKTRKHRLSFDGNICAFEEHHDIQLCELPNSHWLEFGDVFLWCLSDEATDIVREYLDQFND